MKITPFSLLLALVATHAEARTPWTQPVVGSSLLAPQLQPHSRHDHHRLAAALTVRGGAKNTNNRGSASVNNYNVDDDDDAAANNVVQKVLMALGAFALQQTLTKYVEARGNVATVTTNNRPVVTKSSRSIVTTTKTTAKSDSSSDGATIPEHVFNMVKGIVGVGVLSLPAGIAAFGNAPSAIIPAAALISLIGVLSAIGFTWTGQVCAIMAKDKRANTPKPSYRQAWSYSISEQSSWIPSVSVTAMTFLACLCFSMVLTDSLVELVKPLVAGATRTSVLWTVSALVLMPLCWMKDLKSLAPFSLLGVAGMAYTGLAMAGRYFGGIYSTEGSALLEKVPEALRPAFGTDGWKSVTKPGSIILTSMLSTAYMCHFNAPKFYNELKDNTVPRFQKTVAAGFGISILMTAFIACIGFATFGGNSNGLVLNNYAPTDLWMGLSRVAVAISLTFSYPLCFQGLREGALDVIGIAPTERKDSHLNVATVVLLLGLTLLATLLKDVSVVLAFTGATLGNLLCYIFPALMYGRVNPNAKIPALILGVLGVASSIVGVKLAIDAL